jgi:hypothetical protein
MITTRLAARGSDVDRMMQTTSAPAAADNAAWISATLETDRDTPVGRWLLVERGGTVGVAEANRSAGWGDG